MKLLIALMFCFAGYAQAEVGCMDNSYHGSTSYGYDYKSYHYVECYCPCQKFVQTMDRGYCLKCGHYRGILDY